MGARGSHGRIGCVIAHRHGAVPFKAVEAHAGQPVEAPADGHDALVLPGGAINPDLLRVEQKALDLITSFWSAKTVAGAIRHAPWLLVGAGIAKGRRSGARHQPVVSMRSATKRSVSVW
ncbi:hypothetical protein FJ872_28945 [Mesorhizobium sp. B2-5-9]|nr:hypothetical protein FJ872_28945 [Mesorhizobium sp. B2-5-9]TPK82533.1 hypothetical protein FJ936_23855 [Mesorhizobium sp. B2-4-13]